MAVTTSTAIALTAGVAAYGIYSSSKQGRQMRRMSAQQAAQA